MLICCDCGASTERCSNAQKRCPGCRLAKDRADRKTAKRRTFTPAPPRPMPDWKLRQSNRHPDDGGGGAPIPMLSRQTELDRKRRAARRW